ncbi:terminase small subunit [Paludisphaera soli]|uniref:terminase small subunit n=1 Tax=Paludisphaera soli TaxID=2712865 RepID=UPI0013EB2162|nr:terminase small subunit [Paludisphaera soli]
MTEMQRRFCDAYLDGARYNATQAARLAGFAWPNKQGPRLMQHPEVGPAVEAEFLRRHPGVARMEAEWAEAKRREAVRSARNARRRERRRADKASRSVCQFD